MTGKRFTIIGEDNIEFIMQTKLFLPIYDTDKRLSLKNCCDLLNELNDENEQLKSDNFNLNKSVEYLDEIVKEQCIKLDYASECGVKWGKEFKNWKGYE